MNQACEDVLTLKRELARRHNRLAELEEMAKGHAAALDSAREEAAMTAATAAGQWQAEREALEAAAASEQAMREKDVVRYEAVRG